MISTHQRMQIISPFPDFSSSLTVLKPKWVDDVFCEQHRVAGDEMTWFCGHLVTQEHLASLRLFCMTMTFSGNQGHA